MTEQADTLAHVMSRENFSRFGSPLPSLQFRIRSILFPWWLCFSFPGMVSAPYAKPTTSTSWRINRYTNDHYTVH